MTFRIQPLLVVVFLFAGAAAIRAEIVHYTYDLSNTAARTLQGLGTSFVMGCSILAVGVVAAAMIAKRK